MSFIVDEYYCPVCYYTQEEINRRDSRPEEIGDCPKGCTYDTYQCDLCGDHDGSLTPNGSCSACVDGTIHLTEVRSYLKRGIGNTKFCLVADGGGTTRRAMERGKVSEDQAMRQKDRLRQRSRDYCKSPEGVAVRMAQKERLEKRMGVKLADKPFRVDKW